MLRAIKKINRVLIMKLILYLIVTLLIMEVIGKIETKHVRIWIDDEGILNVKIKEGAEINLQEIQACFDAYTKLGCLKNKVLQLMEGGAFLTFNKDALQYAADNGKYFFVASAIVNNSMTIRMLFNFFNKFFKQPVPFKMFSTKAEALEWLKTFR